MEPNNEEDSWRFGVWPGIVGLAAAAFIVWSMFKLSTGML